MCKLHTNLVSDRVCDMVHGTPEPDFQTCLDNGNVPWNAKGTFDIFLRMQIYTDSIKYEIAMASCYCSISIDIIVFQYDSWRAGLWPGQDAKHHMTTGEKRTIPKKDNI